MKILHLSLLALVLAVPAGIFYLQYQANDIEEDNPLKHEFTEFRIGDMRFRVPVYYFEGGTVPDEMMDDWKREKRMASAKFRNIFDGRCYEKCVATQGAPEMTLLDFGGLEAAKKKLAEYKDEECHNPYYKAPDWPDYAQVGKEGNLCYHHFIYKSLFAFVRFQTGDYPVESIPYLEKQARSFLDRFVQPMSAKGE
jgi:hypothetical protein